MAFRIHPKATSSVINDGHVLYPEQVDGMGVDVVEQRQGHRMNSALSFQKDTPKPEL